jgi:hypothetical protein
MYERGASFRETHSMRFVIYALAFSLIAAQANAQTTPAPAAPATAAPASSRAATMAHRFEAANTTHDGHLTKAQAQAAHWTTVVRHFDAIDKDHTGYVTADQLSTYAAAQRAQRKAPATPPG